MIRIKARYQNVEYLVGVTLESEKGYEPQPLSGQFEPIGIEAIIVDELYETIGAGYRRCSDSEIDAYTNDLWFIIELAKRLAAYAGAPEWNERAIESALIGSKAN